MQRLSITFLLLIQLFIIKNVQAQKQEFSGWGAYFHTQKFSKHWGALFDAQFRSGDDLKYLKNPLLRPAVSYYFNPQQFVSVGYLFTGTYNQTADDLAFRREQRSWEQFIQSHKVRSNVAVQHRFRLEQRYIDNYQDKEAFFAQRLRYFIRGVVPFQKGTAAFTKGPFVGLQNEVFVNVQNQDKVNNSAFDQNRAYLSLGYRMSKQFDVEAGYLNQYINQIEQNTMNHVIQVALYTRLGF